MILHLNHTRRESAGATTSEVVESLLALLDDGQLTQAQFAGLRIHLDWIQYKHNFREAVTVMQSGDGRNLGPLMEARIDSRQVTPGSVREAMQRAIRYADPEHTEKPERIYLEEFRSFRSSIAWEFNRLYWQRLKDWEQATGKGYEQALPGGRS